MELEWLKKKLPTSVEAKRTMLEPAHPDLSLRRQCELLGLNRSTWYYQPAGESADNLQLMRLIDEQYLRTPFYGWPRMTVSLRRAGFMAKAELPEPQGRMGPVESGENDGDTHSLSDKRTVGRALLSPP